MLLPKSASVTPVSRAFSMVVEDTKRGKTRGKDSCRLLYFLKQMTLSVRPLFMKGEVGDRCLVIIKTAKLLRCMECHYRKTFFEPLCFYLVSNNVMDL